MLDLISREAAIAAVENARQSFALPDDVPGSRMVNAGFAAARGALEKVPPESEWISVNDRLPILSIVIACFKTELGEIGVWPLQLKLTEISGENSCQWEYADGTHFDYEVTHWQPLPAPPAG